jgi:NADPH-dependent glutamate synthase beta subunit-like oxidoreductase
MIIREMTDVLQFVVIGAGNTAIDCATIAKRLGAEQVTMIYRRTAAEMTAYPHEYDFVKKEGVGFRFLTQPVRKGVSADESERANAQTKDADQPQALPYGLLESGWPGPVGAG